MAEKGGLTHRRGNSSAVNETKDDVATEHVEFFDQKKADVVVIEKIDNSLDDGEDGQYQRPPTTARDLVCEILLVEDDPTMNPWTFRTWFIGIGMSVFAGYAEFGTLWHPRGHELTLRQHCDHDQYI